MSQYLINIEALSQNKNLMRHFSFNFLEKYLTTSSMGSFYCYYSLGKNSNFLQNISKFQSCHQSLVRLRRNLYCLLSLGFPPKFGLLLGDGGYWRQLTYHWPPMYVKKVYFFLKSFVDGSVLVGGIYLKSSFILSS